MANLEAYFKKYSFAQFSLEICNHSLPRQTYSNQPLNFKCYQNIYRVWAPPAEALDVALAEPGDGLVAAGGANPGTCSPDGKF